MAACKILNNKEYSKVKTFKETWEEKKSLVFAEAKGTKINVKDTISTFVSDGKKQLYNKAAKLIERQIKGKSIAFSGLPVGGSTSTYYNVTGTAIAVIAGEDYDGDSYVTITLKNGKKYGGVSDVEVLD